MAAPDDAGVTRRGQLVGVAFVVGALLIAALLGTGAFSGDDPAKDASVVDGVRGTRETSALLRGVPQDGITLGRPDAPVTVVEFVDLKCPVCRSYVLREAPTVVRDLVRPGKANLEVRILGLEQFRPDTLLGRTAVHALAAQDRAWDLLELLYYNQGPEQERWITPALLRKLAAASPELRGTTVTTTPTPETTRLADEADRLAKELDLGGTPTIYVRPRGRTDVGSYREVSLKGTGSDAGKVAAAVADATR